MGMMPILRQVWGSDLAKAIMLARMSRAALPQDLLERVAARNAAVREQTARIREAKTIQDRVNVQMAMIGASAGPPSFSGPAPIGFDAETQMFELCMGLAAQDLPPLPDPGGVLERAMEACLRGTLTPSQFWAAILPVEHRSVAAELETLSAALRSMGPQMLPIARVFDQLPRVMSALSLPEARLSAFSRPSP